MTKSQARILLSDIACCSLMRLDRTSLEKLLDLMVIFYGKLHNKIYSLNFLGDGVQVAIIFVIIARRIIITYIKAFRWNWKYNARIAKDDPY